MRREALHRVWIGALVWATLLAGSARASELGTEFAYQGRLRQGGAPLTGTPDLAFSLWDAATDGAQIGTPQSLLSHPVTNGLFMAPLDFGAGAFDGAARWLQIVVEGETLAPRQKLTAAPYALYALGAPWSGLSGIPAGFDDGTDDVGWALNGNSNTDPDNHFLGTSDNLPLVLRVNNEPALRLEPAVDAYGNFSPNLIGGHSANNVTAGVAGATLSGGGSADFLNTVTDDYGTVGGGYDNDASGGG
ncbi:hypothetical protein ACFL09_06765, partial [Planctomycetota bacterium]